MRSLPQGSPEAYSQCNFLPQAQSLVNVLKGLDAESLQRLMKISPKLAAIQKKRFTEWQLPFATTDATRAIYTFDGDTYKGLDADSLTQGNIAYAQQHLRIISGLYGLLRPLDLMRAYRLEMGTKIEGIGRRNLYDFWRCIVSQTLDRLAVESGAKAIVNCASHEYFNVVDTAMLQVPVITTVFKEVREGVAKIIAFCAKRARGMMARYIVENTLTNPEKLKNFTVAGYNFSPEQSDGENFVFCR